MIVIGVDVGGTFTDIIISYPEMGTSSVHKVPSTPDSQERAVVTGVTEILSSTGIDSSDITLLVHGTTVATNAMLQRKGADVCLLTTKGLEDVLEIGRQNRQEIYDFAASRPEPVVQRLDRVGVNERLSSEGHAIIHLENKEIDRIYSWLKTRNPEAVAISFLFSFMNGDHESRLMRALADIPELYVVASSKVLPEFREFERTSTTVLEAYLGPLVLNYLNRLDAEINGICPKAKLTVMQSNGGTMLCSRTSGKAVGLAISGLAGGVIGGWEIAKQNGVRRAITLDMGGTSCDISAVSEQVIVRSDNEVGGLPIRVPSVDVKTIGAGGGSIAWIDGAGVLHVGPQSAGAIPGPASYSKGGREATITDANLVLGRLNPDFFVGGRIRLDMEEAKRAIASIADKLEMAIDEAALGIIRISTNNMVQAIREVTIERGRDPRDFVLVPFGGAGPTQAVDIAEALSINRILVPPNPGITSALGLICADLRVDLMRSVLVSQEDGVSVILRSALAELSNTAKNELLEQGADLNHISLQWSIDMRYKGQSHELNIPIQSNIDDIADASRSLFESEHESSFGYRLVGRQVEWVTTRVSARYPQTTRITPKIGNEKMGKPISERSIVVKGGGKTKASVYRREDLIRSQTLVGPVIVEQLDTTTFIGVGWTAELEDDGSMWLRRESS